MTWSGPKIHRLSDMWKLPVLTDKGELYWEGNFKPSSPTSEYLSQLPTDGSNRTRHLKKCFGPFYSIELCTLPLGFNCSNSYLYPRQYVICDGDCVVALITSHWGSSQNSPCHQPSGTVAGLLSVDKFTARALQTFALLLRQSGHHECEDWLIETLDTCASKWQNRVNLS